MRALIVHNRYRQVTPSGENLAVEEDVRLLRASGVEVQTLFTSSDDIDLGSASGLLRAATGPVRSPAGVRLVRTALREHHPDVMHVHNVNPLLSPSVVTEARRASVPVVATVHNFRLDCVNGLYFRDGAVCTDCQGRTSAAPAVRHGCYHDSRLRTLPMVVGRAAHRQTWLRVDAWVALTGFHRDFLTEHIGVDDARVHVRPTPVGDPGPVLPPGRDVVFVGRIDAAKGAAMLVDAWQRARPPGRRLRLVGDGPHLPGIRQRVADDESVEVVGRLDASDVAKAVQQAAAVAVPSRWFEGYPRVVAEAFAHGRPVLASDLGALRSIVDDTVGWSVPGGAESWARVLGTLSDDSVRRRGQAARQRYENELHPSRAAGSLLAVYQAAAG